MTIDAMGWQTEIAQTIVARGRDYLLSIKDNPPKRHEAIQDDFAIAEAQGFSPPAAPGERDSGQGTRAIGDATL